MASALQTIKVDVEKFFKGTATAVENFAAAFVKLFKKAPSAIQVVENFTNMVAPVIEAAVALAAPAVEPAVLAALTTAETGLAAIQAAAAAAVSGTSLLTNLESFASTVPTLLSGLDIKDANLKAAVEKIVTLVTGEAKVLIPAVASWVAQIKSASPSA